MKCNLICLIYLSAIALSCLNTNFGNCDSGTKEIKPKLPNLNDDNDTVMAMTTPESTGEETTLLNLANDDIPSSTTEENCGIYNTCEECYQKNCSWIQCANVQSACTDEPDELCPQIQCDNATTTSSPNDTTTTSSPNDTTTTSSPNDTTTTTSPNDTTTVTAVPTTTVTDSPTTMPPTTGAPITTDLPTTTFEPTTGMPSPTTPATPHGRHFDTASFFGGIFLTATLVCGSFFGYKYYKRREQATNYSNF